MQFLSRRERAKRHGGRSRSGGQHALYTITQLFLFREGRRDFAPMVALGKQMTDDDLRGFSDAIGRLPAVPPAASAEPAVDANRLRQGQALAQQHRCMFCHGADLAGGEQVPRVGGQKEDYVRMTLRGFKSGQRPAYTRAMTEALSQVPEGDLDVLAYFVARTTTAVSPTR